MAAIKKKVEAEKPAKKAAPRSSSLSVTIAKKRSNRVTKPVETPTVKTKRSASKFATEPKGKVIKRSSMPNLTIELMTEICRRIANGEAAYKVLESPSVKVDTANFYTKLRDHEVYAKMYRDAMERRGEKFADELTELADEARNGSFEDIQALKLMVNTRQWVVSRLLPKKYGDKVTVAGDAENPLVTQLVVSGGDLVKRIKGGD